MARFTARVLVPMLDMFHGQFTVSVALLIIGVFGVGLRVHAEESPEPGMTSVEQPAAGTNAASEKNILPSDPNEVTALHQRLDKEQAARRAAAAEETRRAGLKWRGNKFTPSAKRESKEDFARQESVAKILSASATVPQGRLASFDWVLSKDAYKCVGWYGTVENISEAPAGRTVQLLVRPTLVTSGGRATVFTPYASRETWKIDASNKPVCEKVEMEPGSQKIVFVD